MEQVSGSKRLLIADDHPPARAGVRYTFEQAGWEVCAEVGDAMAAVEAAREQKPDVCLLDIHMPGGGGIRAARVITNELPDCAVVMLTVSRDDDDVFNALQAGASGYLLKDMDPDRMPQALEGVLAGEAALPRALVAKVLDEFRGRSRRRGVIARRTPANSLSSREWEVLDLLREGLSTSEIAERLFISAATVRSHIASTLKKLRVPDRKGAIELMDQMDLPQP
jgi:DNA-binding NarL/FixJ family response regulator